MCVALLMTEQQSPNLVTPMRFTCLESALTSHAVGEEAAEGEGGK